MARLLGAQCTLRKPFEVRALLAAVREGLQGQSECAISPSAKVEEAKYGDNLVVDDVPTNRQFLATLLGYSQFTKVVQTVAPFWFTIVRLPLD